MSFYNVEQKSEENLDRRALNRVASKKEFWKWDKHFQVIYIIYVLYYLESVKDPSMNKKAIFRDKIA